MTEQFQEPLIKLESEYDIACLNELENMLSSDNSCDTEVEVKTEPSNFTTSQEYAHLQYNDAYYYNSNLTQEAFNQNFFKSTNQFDTSGYFIQAPRHSEASHSDGQYYFQANSINKNQYQNSDNNVTIDYTSPPLSPECSIRSCQSQSDPVNYSYYQSYSSNYCQNASTSSPK